MDDPIAFFDHLAAKSSGNITSQSSSSQGGDSISNDEQPRQQQSHILETIKLVKDLYQENKPIIIKQEQEMNELQRKWDNLIKSHRIEKEVLSNRLQDHLIALAQVDDHFNRANIDLYNNVEISYLQLQKDLRNHRYNINAEKRQFEREKELIKEVRKFQDEKAQITQIKLNVGGQVFETSLTTLRKDPNSMLAEMFSENSTLKPDADNSYFIDRDSTYFRLVLNYLRDSRIPSGIVEDPKITDELMQEARFYRLNDLLKLKWDNLPVITQEQLYKLYPLPTTTAPNNQYRPIIMHLTKKNLTNLDFSNYHIDPRSSFSDSNLENSQFLNAKFGFDFDYKVDFSYTFLVNATFPKEGTTNRASGVEFKLDGAIGFRDC